MGSLVWHAGVVAMWSVLLPAPVKVFSASVMIMPVLVALPPTGAGWCMVLVRWHATPALEVLVCMFSLPASVHVAPALEALVRMLPLLSPASLHVAPALEALVRMLSLVFAACCSM